MESTLEYSPEIWKWKRRQQKKKNDFVKGILLRLPVNSIRICVCVVMSPPLLCIWFSDLFASSLSLYLFVSLCVFFHWYTIHMEIHSLLVKKRNRSSFFENFIFYDPFINFIWCTLLSSFLFSFDLFLNFIRCISFFPFSIAMARNAIL